MAGLLHRLQTRHIIVSLYMCKLAAGAFGNTAPPHMTAGCATWASPPNTTPRERLAHIKPRYCMLKYTLTLSRALS